MDIFLIRVPYVNLRHTQLFDLVESIQTKQSSNPNALKRILGALRSWFVVFISTLSSERKSKQVPALFSYRRNHRVERLAFHQAHRHWASIRSKFTLDPRLSNPPATSRFPSSLPHRPRPPGNMHQIKPIISSHPACKNPTRPHPERPDPFPARSIPRQHHSQSVTNTSLQIVHISGRWNAFVTRKQPGALIQLSYPASQRTFPHISFHRGYV